MSERPLIILAGGGSAGHLSPALAVAEQLQIEAPHVDLFMLATDRPVDHTVLDASGLDWQPQTVRPLPQKLKEWPGFLINWWTSVGDAVTLMRRRPPVAVLGTGGYASVPASRAAMSIDIPFLMLNPDAAAGMANRQVAENASVIFVQWERARQAFQKHPRVRVTGCPVRRALREATREDGIEVFGLDPDRFTLLITGGSQGARTINLTILGLLGQIAAYDNWQVLHITGELDYETVRAAHDAAHMPTQVVAFTGQMAEAIAAADLVVSRAGAVTLAELTCVGRPSILMPYPFDDALHQMANAEVLEEAGAARIVKDQRDASANAPALGDALAELMGNPELLEEMTLAAIALGKPDAAKIVADELRAFTQ